MISFKENSKYSASLFYEYSKYLLYFCFYFYHQSYFRNQILHIEIFISIFTHGKRKQN